MHLSTPATCSHPSGCPQERRLRLVLAQRQYSVAAELLAAVLHPPAGAPELPQHVARAGHAGQQQEERQQAEDLRVLTQGRATLAAECEEAQQAWQQRVFQAGQQQQPKQDRQQQQQQQQDQEQEQEQAGPLLQQQEAGPQPDLFSLLLQAAGSAAGSAAGLTADLAASYCELLELQPLERQAAKVSGEECAAACDVVPPGLHGVASAKAPR